MKLINKYLKKNFYLGRDKHKPQLVVIHIAQGTRESVWEEFNNKEKSSHYLVNTDGSIWRFVSESDTAWTQGLPKNPSSKIVREFKKNPNLISISIEHEGVDNINETQYLTSGELIKDICTRNNIPLDRDHIIGHREINNSKNCPAGINIEKLIEYAIKGETLEKKISWFQAQLNYLLDLIKRLK